MDRLVSIISSRSQDGAGDTPRPFASFSDVRNIVLLGDAGAGKTHLFGDAAQRHGRYITARAFLSTPQLREGETVFIDGLDEKRAGRGDRDTIDAMVGKLFAARPAKVRISCRVADWLGDSDIAALAPYFDATADPVVLVLNRLTTDEQIAVLCANGASGDAARSFLGEAQRHSLEEFLANPQNLIMLWDVVAKEGAWPRTYRELFERSTDLMLREANQERARSGSGVYSVAELRPAAGAACAARLISDVAGIGLADAELVPDYPSYRTLSTSAPERTLAALERRAFTKGSLSETVDYAHRTVAEYLAAEWLADRVRRGLPLSRVLALMGVDGHPATELRGLHAWLAIHLPEDATRLIDADPYGVLTYGDAASLSQQACKHLLVALSRVAERDPWFRSERRQAPTIAAVVRPDMVSDFRSILESDSASSALRGLIVDAIGLAPPMWELNGSLAVVLRSSKRPFAERLSALDSLVKAGVDGKDLVRAIFRSLKGGLNELRLRAQIIAKLYGEPFGPREVLELLQDLASGEAGVSGTMVLYGLENVVPLADVPAILDGLPRHASPLHRERHPEERQVDRYVTRLVVRAWTDMPEIDPDRALDWLTARMVYAGGTNHSDYDDLRVAIEARPEMFDGIVDAFLDRLAVDSERWARIGRFRLSVAHAIPATTWLGRTLAAMDRAEPGSLRELFFYEAAFTILFALPPAEVTDALENLIAKAGTRQDLREICDASLACRIPDYYFEREPQEPQASLREIRDQFAKDAAAIRDGVHLPGLNYAAAIYFARFSDVDDALSPEARLVDVLGQTNADAALAGFKAALGRQKVPTLAEILELQARRQIRDWWFVLSAGVTEEWKEQQDLEGLSDDFLMAMLVFDLSNPNHQQTDGSGRMIVPAWRAALSSSRPELVRGAFVSLARSSLGSSEHRADVLREMLHDPALAPWRASTALALLRDFPNASPFSLEDLFGVVFGDPASRATLLEIAEMVLAGDGLGDVQRDKWLGVAYLLAPHRFAADLVARAERHPEVVFALRDRLKLKDGEETPRAALPQLEFLAALVGKAYPRTSHPDGVVWGGNDNPWDAAEFCLGLISRISTHSSAEATAALIRLESNSDLSSYRHELGHALAGQEQRRRDAEYDRPDWSHTVTALSGGAPGTVADLHALLIDQLRDVAYQIRHANTDIFKSFWNVDSHSRPTTPRPEEACRDVLVTLLRPRLAPMGVTVEPEGHMLGDKRADISVAMPGRKILVELKRDHHGDMWTAPEHQLERLYAHDPEARGFGVYGIFWFGARRTAAMPNHPADLAPPENPEQLHQMLWYLIPDERKSRTAVIIIDVSPL